MAYENLCLTCGVRIEPAPVEVSRGNGKYCSRSCSSAASSKSRHKKLLLAYNKNKKQCVRCKKSLPYHKKHNLFCSHTCYSDGKKKPARITHCLWCKEVIRFKLECERPDFCNAACYSKLKKQQFISAWLSGKETGTTKSGDIVSTIRPYLLKKSNNRCELCGWGKKNKHTGLYTLQVDHKNGKSWDNRPSNLRVLCPNCHSLTSTYGFLNKGSGRKGRYKVTKQ